ncbi:Calx-beta domain-containing protein [Brevifollis gellanilyticus]|uniref:PKD domain-containing protein n=1 Tax=Brevifollis gellanilyticus TaxID=748831 RepID=A0A512M627_9BACT|nr:Calx-beta domain-containing protein [Brevifollis gellanilyticus]GEP42188.1 hypothetical protein BGE01nite_14790 [Brevifollis gellanilyticus]
MRFRTASGLAALVVIAVSAGIYLSKQETISPVAVSGTALSAREDKIAPVDVLKSGHKSKAENITAEPLAPADPLTGFDDWSRDYLSLSPEQRERMVDEGVRLAKARRPVFKELIKEDPRSALAQAVPMVVRQALPPQILGELERRINDVGALRVMMGVPLDPNDPPVPTTREVELKGGGTYRAYLYGRRENQLSTPGVLVNGVAIDSEFAVSEEPTRRLEVGETLPKDKPVVSECPVSGKSTVDAKDVPAQATEASNAVESPTEVIFFCDGSHIAVQNQTLLMGEGVTGGALPFSGILPATSTPSLGNIKVLVMHTTYADQNAAPTTEAALYKTLRDVGDYYAKASYGRLSLVGVVTPVLKLPHNEAWYVNRDTSNGGDLGGTGQEHADARAEARKLGYDTNDYDSLVMRHNGGPGSYGGLASVPGSTVWVRGDSAGLWAHEIGHSFGLLHSNFWDTAGTSSIGNGANQEYGDSYDIMGGGPFPGGHYNAAGKNQIRWLPSEFVQPVTQPGVYRIYAYDQGVLDASRRYAMTVVKDVQRTYWGMVRAQMDSNPFAKSGMVLGWKFPNGGGSNFQLIDTTPGSPYAKTDAPISLGATFADVESGIFMTTVAANDNPRYVDVQVNMGSFPGNHPPTLSLAANATVVPTNGSVTFTATASDTDGDTLAYNWQHFGGGSQIVSPNANVITRQFASAGTYIVTCTVSDMKGGTVTRNQLITVGSPSTFTISGRITLLGAGLSDVAVTANGANGVITDADGYYTIPNLAANTYTITPLLYGYSFGELFNNSITVGPSFSGADFEATASSVVTIAAVTPTANEGTLSPGVFRLTRTGDNSQPLTVSLSNPSGSATLTTDYTLSPAYTSASPFNSWTIPADASTLDISVTPAADAISEGAETVVLQLGSGSGYLLGAAANATVTITDDDTVLPKVSMIATTPDTTEGSASPAVVTFSRTGSTAAALTVNFGRNVASTSAVGSDHPALGSTVTIPIGAASTTLNITTLNDSISEQVETVILNLLSGSYLLDSLASTTTANIYDDDLQTVTVSVTDPVATEVNLATPGAAADTGTFVLTRSGDVSAPLTVYYAFSGGSSASATALHGVDFELMPGSVVIPASQTTASITIIPRFDDVGEGPEDCVITIGANSTNYVVGSASSATVTINDNPADKAFMDVVNTSNATEPSTNATFRFTPRGSTSAFPFLMNYTLAGTTTNGTDYDTVSWWLPQTSGSSANLNAVFAVSSTAQWVVGEGGVILKGDGTNWTAQTSGTTNNLRGIWGTSTTNLYAVGDGGVVLRSTNGTSWSAMTSGTTNNLRGIWGSGTTNIFAVGDGGVILRSTNGTSWTTLASGTTNQLRAVHGSASTNIWFVGAAGTVLFYNNTTVTPITSGTTAQLNGVYSTGTNATVVVGAGGMIRRGGSTGTWTQQSSLNSFDLNGVWGSGASNVFISGASSSQMLTTGSTNLTYVNLSALGSFNAVNGTGTTLAWSVGANGAIFKRDTSTGVNVPSSLVISSGVTTFDLTLRTKDDVLTEDRETITLSIDTSSNYQTFVSSGSATAWMIDNDNVSTVVADVQVGSGSSVVSNIVEGGATTPVKFYLNRTGSTTAALTVNLSYSGTATNGTDYTAPASVTIPAGALGVDVPVTITNDVDIEGTETIVLNIDPGSYARGTGATMYITDNEAPAQTVAFTANSSRGLENVASPVVEVGLAAPATTAASVEYYVDSGSRTSSSASNNTQTLAYWLRIVKTGTTFVSSASNDGVTWTQLDSQSITGFTATSYLAGLCVASAANPALNTATFDSFTVNGLSGGSLGTITSADVGTVGAAGSYAEASGTYTVIGSGSIGSTADAFRYVWFPVNSSSNCTIVARVLTQSPGSQNTAQAGIMIRESTTANVRSFAAMHVPSTGRVSARRTTVAGSTSSVSAASMLRPRWVRLQRAGEVFTSSWSPDGSTWTTVGTPQTMALAPEVLAGLAVSARSDSATNLTTATFDNVSLSGSPGLLGRTVGFVNAQGTDTLTTGTYTVSAAGAQIGSTEDECHFVAAPVSGDFTLIARVLTQTGGASNAQAGVMVRETANYRTRSLYLGSVANSGVEFIYRTTSVTTGYGAGVDFLLPDGVLNFAIGEQFKYVPLSIINDTIDEGTDNLCISLRNASSAVIGTVSQHIYTIVDNDAPPTNLYAGFTTISSSVSESAGTAQIAVSLSSTATTACSVNYVTTDGTALNPGDYATTSGTLNFAAGDTVKFISVPITNDTTLEAAEALTLTLSSPSSGLALGSQSVHTLTINDDDAPAVSIAATDASANESGDPGQLTLTRTGPTTSALSVTIALGGLAVNGTDYTTISTTQIIPAGQSGLAINVAPIQNALNEGTKTVIADVVAGSGYVPGTPSSATVSIADDDRSTVTITSNDASASETPGNSGQFTVTRTAPTNVTLTVNVAISGTATNTTDYATVAGTLAFAIGEASKTITITPVDDGSIEGPEDVTISLGSGTYDIGDPSFANVTIADNDNAPSIFITSPTGQGPVIAATNGIILSASVTDDGLPAAVTQTWSLVSGPGTATIESPGATTTAVTFSAPGTYLMRITATDTQFTVSDQVTIVVGSAPIASTWITQDMTPSSARRGQSLEYNGIATVTGTGVGYAASALDSAHVMVRPITGNGSVVARLTSQPTAGALSGVTIRDSLARGCKRVVLGYVPGTGLQMRTRTALGANGSSDTVVTTTGLTLPLWLKLERDTTTDVITGSYSTNGTTWTTVGTTVALTLLNSEAQYGLTTTSNSSSSTATGVFDNVALTPAPSGPALYNEDSGTSPNPAGSGSFDGTNTYTITGGTNGYYYGWQYYGDIDVRCRLTGYSSGAGSSSGGLRITESIEAGAYSHFGKKPTDAFNGYYWVSIAGGGSSGIPSGAGTVGSWIRIVRRGNTVTGYRATHNGTSGGPNSWTQVGQPQTIIMTTPVWVGFYVDNASGVGLNTCTFTNLSISAVNKAPVVAASLSGNVSPVSLDGTITDDDLPAAPTSLWSVRSGSAGITLGNASSVDTAATLLESGLFKLRLTADDTGTKSFSDLDFTGYATLFARWLDQNNVGDENNTAIEAEADADRDGLVNLFEYAVGTNGTVASSNPQVVTLAPVSSSQYLRISIPKNPAATDVTFTVQATSDITNPASWSSAGLVIETNTSTQLIVRDNVPAGPGVRRFMRVMVTRL